MHAAVHPLDQIELPGAALHLPHPERHENGASQRSAQRQCNAGGPAAVTRRNGQGM
jgi:hypothetical protein